MIQSSRKHHYIKFPEIATLNYAPVFQLINNRKQRGGFHSPQTPTIYFTIDVNPFFKY
jgi:hypothetical protein